MMKLNPRVTQLALYDIRMGPGPLVRSFDGFRKIITQISKQVLPPILAISIQIAWLRAMIQLHLACENVWPALILSSSPLVFLGNLA